MIRVRRAQDKDIKRVTELLAQVLELHADLRPDLFIHGTTKYTENQLSDIFADEKTPVFVAVDDCDTVQGYAFCILKEPAFATNMTDIKTLYIDNIRHEQSHYSPEKRGHQQRKGSAYRNYAF